MGRAYAPGHISAISAFVQNTYIAKRWWFKQSSWPIYLFRPICQWPLCQIWGTIHRPYVILLSGPRLVLGWLCPMPDWFLGGEPRKTWKNPKLPTRVSAHHGFSNLACSWVWVSQVWVWVPCKVPVPNPHLHHRIGGFFWRHSIGSSLCFPTPSHSQFPISQAWTCSAVNMERCKTAYHQDKARLLCYITVGMFTWCGLSHSPGHWNEKFLASVY